MTKEATIESILRIRWPQAIGISDYSETVRMVTALWTEFADFVPETTVASDEPPPIEQTPPPKNGSRSEIIEEVRSRLATGERTVKELAAELDITYQRAWSIAKRSLRARKVKTPGKDDRWTLKR